MLSVHEENSLAHPLNMLPTFVGRSQENVLAVFWMAKKYINHCN